ncbi:hypothetical protein SAMN05216232_0154 [Virgibacillus subterraneus]|uniref:Uncharacterized protein n=2 Tax=Virgibacillus TaxID=84406 RepID=A0A1H1DYV5_9BACI|nr:MULTISPECIES: hypothetical protein [Virgibacillus]SDQ81712.1 hypothetical protein SAMN05216231_2646 [Virgibacillus salinus]SER06739.1 hypothetical protein SAMN05216232_0154 [Virgibacillus subterraneus]
MKSLFMTTAAGALILSAGSITDASVIPIDKTKKSNANVEVSEKSIQVEVLPEFTVLDEQVDSDDYQAQVIEDNKQTRVIILKDEDGHAQYKSVYVKSSNVLEVIDLDQGMVFKGVIAD